MVVNHSHCIAILGSAQRICSKGPINIGENVSRLDCKVPLLVSSKWTDASTALIVNQWSKSIQVKFREYMMMFHQVDVRRFDEAVNTSTMLAFNSPLTVTLRSLGKIST